VKEEVYMKRWEYLIESSLWHDERKLQELGEKGWELVLASPGGKWVFKRELEEHQATQN
jgi:hypothetical protein